MKVCEQSRRCEFERSCGIPEPGRLCNLETLGHGTLESLQAHLLIMINYLTAAYLTAAYLTADHLTAAYLTAACLTANCPSPPHTLIVVICRICISACIRLHWGFLSFVVLMLTDCFHSSFAVM